mgnify:CR=1 FL=1
MNERFSYLCHESNVWLLATVWALIENDLKRRITGNWNLKVQNVILLFLSSTGFVEAVALKGQLSSTEQLKPLPLKLRKIIMIACHRLKKNFKFLDKFPEPVYFSLVISLRIPHSRTEKHFHSCFEMKQNKSSRDY